MSNPRLQEKVAIIVGAGQQPGQTVGNGRATAERFAEEGATLLLVDINAAQVEDTLRAVQRPGAKASTFVADITREEDCRALAQACMDRYGRIDILHNNVGSSTGDRKTVDLDVAVWDSIM